MIVYFVANQGKQLVPLIMCLNQNALLYSFHALLHARKVGCKPWSFTSCIFHSIFIPHHFTLHSLDLYQLLKWSIRPTRTCLYFIQHTTITDLIMFKFYIITLASTINAFSSALMELSFVFHPIKKKFKPSRINLIFAK